MAKPKTKTVNTSFTCDAQTNERLRKLAGDAGVTVAQYIAHLINRAWDEPDGYYLRTAAIHSFTAAALAQMIAFKTFGPAAYEQVSQQVDEDSAHLFGALPAPPVGLADQSSADPRVSALMAAYKGLPREI